MITTEKILAKYQYATNIFLKNVLKMKSRVIVCKEFNYH